MLEIIPITKYNADLLEAFVKSPENDTNSFRYFESRPLTIIENHLCTYVLKIDNIVCGYGHLDKEADVIWLGVSVLTTHQGFGFGNLLVQTLLSSARYLEISKVRLSVDNNNPAAIHIYEKLGFDLLNRRENISFYELEIER